MLLLLAALAAAPDDARLAVDEGSVRIEALGETAAPGPPPVPAVVRGGAPSPAAIAAAGRAAWELLVRNRPVLDAEGAYAAALPEGVDWREMAGWRGPEGAVYAFTAKNLYGWTVVDLRYEVTRAYGGAWRGRGRYLTAVAVRLLKADVALGYSVSMRAEVPPSSVVNAGTDEEPLAALQATVRWRVETPVRISSREAAYALDGAGGYRELGDPVSVDTAAREALR